MYTGFLHIHSALRYVVLILAVLAIARAFSGWFVKKPFTPKDKKIATFAVISAHLQMLVGLTLYFISPLVQFGNGAMKDPVFRFWGAEHIAGMLVGIIILTIGNARSKKAATDLLKHKQIAVFFTIAIIIIFLFIPWPFSKIARPWF